MKAILSLMAAVVLFSFSGLALADDGATLESLLNNATGYQVAEKDINKAREAAFRKDLSAQKALLAEAKQQLKQEQQRAERLKNSFDANEIRLTDKEEELRLRVGNLGEMFGVVRQVATDLQTVLSDSLTTVQVPQRRADLEKLSEAKELPNISELEDLWFTLQQEMTLNGQIVQFDADVIDATGQSQRQTITRVGVFNAVSEHGYLVYDADVKQLGELGRQPGVADLFLII